VAIPSRHFSGNLYVFLNHAKNQSRNRENGKDLVSVIKCLSHVSCLYVVENDDFFALADKNEMARLTKSLMERIFKGKCSLREEMQREGHLNVAVEYTDV
jgi:hypothetical protein